MSNTCYPNFFLSNEIEDQYNSLLDLQRFCTIDNGLVGTAGMKRIINRYRASNSVQKVAVGNGNTYTSEASYTPFEYDIVTAQGRFKYQDEDAMKDPMVVTTGVRHLGVDMFNTVNADIYAEFNKADLVVIPSAIGFDCFADAQAMMNIENLEGVEFFGFINAADTAALRIALKGTLQYVEAFARSGYIGTVAGINIYTKKDAVTGQIIIGTREAVTVFNKKGVEVEQTVEGSRSSDDANTRSNYVFARKYYVAALTHGDRAVKILPGGSAAVSSDTSVNASKTYYEASGLGYVAVVPEESDNPHTKGWYEIAPANP